ncbi:MAG TPA: hypothetical protein VG166_05025 [Caulobacteraceae bacterium]|nr:hypothetical protein [Caulobacteraceae bacterium]
MAADRPEPEGPGRHRLGLLFAVLGAPLAWSGQVVFGAAFAAYPFVPQGTLFTTAPLSESADRLGLFAANLIAIVVAALATWVAWQAWQGARGDFRGTAAGLLAERLTRTRYLAMWGLLNGSIFIAALLFDTVMLIGTPATC